MPETNSEPGVITPTPSEPSQEQAGSSVFESKVGLQIEPEPSQAQENDGESWAYDDGELAQEDYPEPVQEQEDYDEILALLGADQEQANFTDQTEDLDWLAEDDGTDWLAEGDQAPMFGSQEELDTYIREQAAEVLQPYALEQEMMNARRDQLGQLEEQYPDILDYADQIRSQLEARAEQYGVDPLLVATDPALVQAVYKGLKAEEAASTETDPATARSEALGIDFSEMANASAPTRHDAFS